MSETVYSDFPALVPNKHQMKHMRKLMDDDDAIKIPLLEEVLSLPATNDVHLFVEFKGEKDLKLISLTRSILMSHDKNPNRRIHWFSLRAPFNECLQQLLQPNFPTVASIREVIITLLLHHVCLLPFLFPLRKGNFGKRVLGLNYDVFGLVAIDINESVLKRIFPTFPDYFIQLLNRLVGGKPSWALLVPSLCEYLRGEGVPTLVLGVEDLSAIQYLADTKADYALSNDVSKIVATKAWRVLRLRDA